MGDEAEIENMAGATKKFTPEIDAQLYDAFVAVAEQNGQTKRHVLEQALKFYLRNVVPSQHLVRPEVMERLRTVGRSQPRPAAPSREVDGGLPDGSRSLPNAASIDRAVRRAAWGPK